MKAKLTAGAEIDFLTEDEMRRVLKDMEADRREIEPTDVRATESGATNAAGGLVIDVYKVPSGRRFRLTRVIVLADGYTPVAPYQNAAAYLNIRRGAGGQIVDFLPLTAASGGGIPAKGEYGDAQAPQFVNVEEVTIELVGGPASTGLTVFVQGGLQPRVPTAVVPA